MASAMQLGSQTFSACGEPFSPLGRFGCGTGVTPRPPHPQSVPIEPWRPPGLFVFGGRLRSGADQPSSRVYWDSPATSLEHHETYLRGVLSLIDLTDTTVIRAESLNLGDRVLCA